MVCQGTEDGQPQTQQQQENQTAQDFNNTGTSMKPHIKCGGNGNSSGSDSEASAPNKKLMLAGTSTGNMKVEVKEENDINVTPNNLGIIKRRKSDDGHSMCSSMQDSMDVSEYSKNDNSLPRKKSTLRTQLAQQIVQSSNKTMKKPIYPVRPQSNHNNSLTGTNNGTSSVLDQTCLLAIFKHLSPEILVTCSMVCKVWSVVAVDPLLWKKMNCSEHKLSASLLTAIVRRQPEHLLLDWTILAKRQLSWMIARIPSMKSLSLAGVPIQAVFGLHTCLCPQLHTLDLSFVRGLNDQAIRELLSPPKDSRPGTDSKSRLKNLRTFKLSGTDVTDVALRYITQGLPYLLQLDLSSCQRITDVGVCQIGTSSSAIKTLYELDLSSCKLITEVSLDYLGKCESLTRLDLRFVPQVSTQSVIKFAAKSQNDLQVQDIKLVDKRKV